MMDPEELKQIQADILEYLYDTNEIKDMDRYQKSIDRIMEISHKIDDEVELKHSSQHKNR
ncbi:hypothetical protein HK407_04g07910 [Ordospora pajunii]|uniref:uncharacterized protein n=1 Tax=Ordospora pajunii TaxID=3039483 RepID=UPI0029527384|nr:uncharacterized protein HK407_04g07910 [Ordospora pajunii]KAH9411681.1 hypothetical protein HK407_04g07910 [Ordospora pajunii]